MRHYLILTLLFLTAQAFGKTLEFDVKMKYVTPERTLNSMSLVNSELGKKFTVSRNGLVAEIHPSLFDTSKLDIETNDLLKLKAKVYQIVGGKKLLIARPEIITKLGSESSIEIQKESGERFIFEITSR